MTTVGRYLHIETFSRVFTVFASTARIALEWEESLRQFYNLSTRTKFGPYQSTFLQRNCTQQLKFYFSSQEFYFNLCQDLLAATQDIFLWLGSAQIQHNPEILLTFPPLPPIKFHHLLRYKAQQGVRIYVLLSSEVD
jgi:hypothetical protein